MTVNDSACARVTPSLIAEVEPLLAGAPGTGMVLAAPEVPLDARMALLTLASRYRWFRSASFSSGEMEQVRRDHLLDSVDYLAINTHEAALLAGLPDTLPPADIATGVIQYLAREYPHLQGSITAGRHGSWAWTGQSLHVLEAPRVNVASTAGAGDAFMAGMLVGYACGLPCQEAQQLATLLGACSVTSPHTIHPEIDRRMLNEFCRQCGMTPGPGLRALLED